MPDPNHLRVLEKGVKAFNEWRKKNPFIIANLVKANLRGADLSGANLSRVHLSEANLSEADLSGVDLRWANLKGADLSRADLKRAHLSDADPRWAKFDNTIITSRTVLTLLKFALTDEQEAAIIFSDEREIANKKNSSNELKNRQYLTNTEDKNIKSIENKLERKCQVRAQKDLEQITIPTSNKVVLKNTGKIL